MINKKIIISFILFLCVIGITRLNAQVEVVSTGTGSAYVINIPAIFPLRNGVQVTFKANVVCNASPTINVTGTGAKNIKKEGGTLNLDSADIKAGQIVNLAYDGTNWQMLSNLGKPALAGAATGSGTQNYVAKWNNPSGTILGNSLIFDDGSNVGIGTTSPLSQFHLQGSSDPLKIMIESSGNNFTTGYSIKTALNEWFIGQEGNSVNGFRITDIDAGFTRFQIDPNGNVGIGTTTPVYLLDVMGRGHFFNGIESAGTINIGNSGSYQTFVAAEFGGLGAGINLQANDIGGHSYTIYSTNPGDGTAGLLKFRDETVGADRMVIDATGRLGLGTNNPASLLHVSGAARFGRASAVTGSQIWNNATNANTVTINSGVTTTSYTLTLPSSQGGANTYLTNNGSGILSWTSAAAGVTNVTASAPLSSSGGLNPNISLTGIVPFANGGTNNSVPYTAGSVIFSNGTSLTQNNPGFFWDNTNARLGIGTSSPATKLHVAGTNPSSIVNQVAENTTSSIQSGIIMQRSRGTVTTPTVISSGDQLGGFYMMGYDGTAFGTNGPAAGISAIAAQSFAAGTGTDMFFSTSNINATSASTKMIITANGNVGIGTSTNPNQKLEIQDGNILLSNTATQSELRFKEANANGGQFVSFKAPASLASNVDYTLPIDAGTANAVLSTDGTGTLSWQNISGTLSGGTINYLPKWNSPNSLSSSSQVYDDGSKVGIGTNAPGEKLQVVSAATAADNAAVSVMSGTSGKASYFLGSSTNGYLGAIQYDNSNNSMNFWTNNTTNRLVINNSGNIGVGTSTPTTKIHSRGDLQIEDPGNSSGVTFNLATLSDGINPVNGTGTKGWQWLAYGNGNGTVAVQNDMRLTWYNGTGTSPFLYFDNANKLGINLPLTTDQPLYDLDVAGTIRTGYAGKDGQLRIYSEQGATDFEATFSPSVAMTQNTVYLLPPNDGNPNDILTSNGSGTLTWNPVSALGLSGSGTTNYLARWTPSGTQLGIGATYDNGTNVGIGTASPGQKLHITDVVNGPKIRLEGPVAGASAMNSTLEFYETSTFKASMGWASQSTQQYWFVYEGGTTSMVSKGANIGIGTVTPGTSRLNVVIPNTDALNPIGLTVTNNYTGASAKYGIDVNVDGAGSGVKYGISSSVIGLAADASSIYGYQVAMTPNGTGSTYGVFSDIAAAGTGIRYGIYNNTTAISTNASTIYGIYNISSKPTGSTGTVYGLRSAANHNGTGTSYGIYSTNTGTAASRFGVYVTGETQNYFSGDVGIGTTAPTSALEVVGNVEIPAANDYIYTTAKTNYISLSSASFTTINALAVDGNGTGNARWISSGVAGVSDNMFATLNLPSGATITNVDVYVYDNDATYEVSANLVRNNLVSNINGTLATTTTTGAAAVPGLAIVSASLSSVVDNSIYMYYLKFNTRQNNTNLWIRGAIVTYTVTKTD